MGVVVIVVAGWLGLAPLATSPPDRSALEIRWDAPSECPPADVVRARIDTLLGGAEARADTEATTVEARAVRSDAGTWTVDLALVGPRGGAHRTISGGADCAEAAEAAAVVVAIAIDPSAAARSIATAPQPEPLVPESEPESEPEAEPEPKPEDEPEPKPEPKPEPRPTPAADTAPRRALGPVRGLAALVGGVGFGHLPGVAGALGLEAGITLPRVRATAAGLYWFRRRQDVQGATVDFRQWAIALRGCPVFRVRPTVELLVCGGLEAGQTLVRTRGLSATGDPNALWLAWLLQPAAVWLPRPWIGLRAGAELVGPIAVPEFRVEPVGVVFQPTPVGLRGLVSVEARFP